MQKAGQVAKSATEPFWATPRRHNRVFLSALEETRNQAVAFDFRNPVVVGRSALGDDEALLGACAAVVSDRLYPGINV